MSMTLFATIPTKAATFTVTNTSDAGAGSLREAINQANLNAGPDTIVFDAVVFGSGASIILTSVLTLTDDQTTIDGWSAGGIGYTGPPLVEIDGNSSVGTGLQIDSNENEIYGLALTGFTTRAIYIFGSDDNHIYANYVGLRLDETPDGNNDGIVIQRESTLNQPLRNIIGADASNAISNELERNIISGNTGDGVVINQSQAGSGSSFADANRIVGNYIGTNVAGDAVEANGESGVELIGGSRYVVIGESGNGNLISGNDSGGIRIAGSNTGRLSIFGNIIGLNADANTILANGPTGNGITAIDTFQWSDIRENTISGNNGSGIFFNTTAGSKSWICDNRIGTTFDSSFPVFGNGQDGIRVARTGSVDGNRIGITTTSFFISSGPCSSGNVIAHNSGNGIRINNQTSLADFNEIRGNLIFDNGQLAIDLNANSIIDTNDASDTDSGGNKSQNHPLITAAASTGTNTFIEFDYSLGPELTIPAVPPQNARVDFYSVPNCSLSDDGDRQARNYLGGQDVALLTGGGDTIVLGSAVPVGEYVLGITTGNLNGWGWSSEFSPCFEVTQPANLDITVFDSTDPTEAGTTFSYTVDIDNIGLGTADDVELTLTLDASATFLSATGSGVCVAASNIITCSGLTIAPLSNESILFNVRAPSSATTITSTFAVTTTSIDNDTTNNSTNESTTITASTSAASDTNTPNPTVVASATEVIIYAIPSTLTPTPTSTQTATATHTATASNTPTSTATLTPTLSRTPTSTRTPTASSTPTFTVTASPTSTTQATTPTLTPSSTYTLIPTITPMPTLINLEDQIKVTREVNIVGANEVQNDFIISNDGSQILYDLRLIDEYLSDEFALTVSSGADISCRKLQFVIECRLGDIPPGLSERFSYLTEGELDSLLSSNTYIQTSTVESFIPSEPYLIKIVSPGFAELGQNVTYTIRAINPSSMTATNIIITDIIPLELIIDDVIAEGESGNLTLTNNDLRYEQSRLEPGELITITIITRLNTSNRPEALAVTNNACLETAELTLPDCDDVPVFFVSELPQTGQSMWSSFRWLVATGTISLFALMGIWLRLSRKLT